MAYEKQEWKSGEKGGTPITADRLNHMEDGIAAAGGEVSSDDISDATDVGKAVVTAKDEAAARTAIGAGTSNLAIGTTATTAMAGNTTIPAAPAVGTAALLEAGTDTTTRTFTAKMIHDEIARQITAAAST